MPLERALQALPEQLDGVYIFPIVPGTKDPATRTGWKEASNDPDQIERWRRVNPDFNWGIATGLSKLMVYDIDPDGLDWWAKLLERDAEIAGHVKPAFQVRTPKGGMHVYFRGEGPSTARRIADGIDTRGGMMKNGKLVSGGYVVAPGSSTEDGPGRVKGVYTSLGGTIAPLPACMAAIIPERSQKDVLGLAKEIDKDLPRNVQTATDLLKSFVASGSVSIEGQAGNPKMNATINAVLSKGISRGKCFELIAEIFNPHCVPPFDDFDLEYMIESAYQTGANTKTGAEGHQSNADAFAAFEGMETPTLEVGKPKPMRLMRIDEYADSVGDPEWLIPDVLPKQGVGVIYGDEGTYKSFVALDLALTLAYGIPGQWQNEATDKQCVMYFAGEAPKGMARLRFPAWMQHYDQEFRSDHGLLFQDRVPFHEDIEEWEDLKQMLGHMRVKPSLIIIDTLSRLMTHMAENESSDAKVIMAFLDNLARYYDCFILVVHHTGKDQNRGARGSKVYTANADTVIQMKKIPTGASMQFQKHKDVDSGEKYQYFTIKPYDVGFDNKGKKLTSIVLVQTKDVPKELNKKGTPVAAWASMAEVSDVLSTKLGGRATLGVLASAISKLYSIENLAMIKKMLNASPELNFLHDGNQWSCPNEGDEENDD